VLKIKYSRAINNAGLQMYRLISVAIIAAAMAYVGQAATDSVQQSIAHQQAALNRI